MTPIKYVVTIINQSLSPLTTATQNCKISRQFYLTQLENCFGSCKVVFVVQKNPSLILTIIEQFLIIKLPESSEMFIKSWDVSKRPLASYGRSWSHPKRPCLIEPPEHCECSNSHQMQPKKENTGGFQLNFYETNNASFM